MQDNSSDWEISKENIQPLSSGRKMASLSHSLQRDLNSESTSSLDLEVEQTIEKYEKYIETYQGNDPLQPWTVLINYLVQERLNENVKYLTKYKDIVVNCVKQFIQDPNYKNDRRFTDIYLRNIQSIPPSRKISIIKISMSRGLGTKVATMYTALAELHEMNAEIKSGLDIIREGMSNGAQPMSVLLEYEKNFEYRIAAQLAESIKCSASVDDGDTCQRVFGNEVPIDPSSNEAASVRIQLPRASSSKASLPRAQKLENVLIFQDENTSTNMVQFKSNFPSLPDPVEEIRRIELETENQMRATKWNATGTQVIGVEPPAFGKIEIYASDEEEEPAVSVKPMSTKGVLAERKIEVEIDTTGATKDVNEDEFAIESIRASVGVVGNQYDTFGQTYSIPLKQLEAQQAKLLSVLAAEPTTIDSLLEKAIKSDIAMKGITGGIPSRQKQYKTKIVDNAGPYLTPTTELKLGPRTVPVLARTSQKGTRLQQTSTLEGTSVHSKSNEQNTYSVSQNANNKLKPVAESKQVLSSGVTEVTDTQGNEWMKMGPLSKWIRNGNEVSFEELRAESIFAKLGICAENTKLQGKYKQNEDCLQKLEVSAANTTRKNDITTKDFETFRREWENYKDRIGEELKSFTRTVRDNATAEYEEIRLEVRNFVEELSGTLSSCVTESVGSTNVELKALRAEYQSYKETSADEISVLHETLAELKGALEAACRQWAYTMQEVEALQAETTSLRKYVKTETSEERSDRERTQESKGGAEEEQLCSAEDNSISTVPPSFDNRPSRKTFTINTRDQVTDENTDVNYLWKPKKRNSVGVSFRQPLTTIVQVNADETCLEEREMVISNNTTEVVFHATDQHQSSRSNVGLFSSTGQLPSAEVTGEIFNRQENFNLSNLTHALNFNPLPIHCSSPGFAGQREQRQEITINEESDDSFELPLIIPFQRGVNLYTRPNTFNQTMEEMGNNLSTIQETSKETSSTTGSSSNSGSQLTLGSLRGNSLM